MRIVFAVLGNSRRSNYLNGDTLRYGGAGGSGTDSSTILVAEHLASKGHEVVIVHDRLEAQLEASYAANGNVFIPGSIVREVQYSYFDFEGVNNREFDILVSSLWFHDYDKLPIKVTKALIYWCHMQWVYGYQEILNYCRNNNLYLGFVNISEWERSMNAGVIESACSVYDKVKTTLIPNPIADDIVKEVRSMSLPRKKHKFIFHAAWARGGNVAIEAVRKLEHSDSEFHAFDYLMATHDHQDSYFHKHNGVDKITLFKHLAESEYFIYPLYTPYKDVHKDTFSCVVAEALAMGVKVLTYKLGALSDNFDGHVYWLDPPPGSDLDRMNTEPLSKDEAGIFNYTDNIVDMVRKIESGEVHSVKTGEGYILEKFNVNTVGAMWENFIKELTA